MDSSGAPQISFSGSNKTYLIGDIDTVSHLRKVLSSLSLYIPDSNEDIYAIETHNCIVIVCCDFTDPRSLKLVSRSLQRIKNPRIVKVIYSKNDHQSKFYQLVFGHAIGARFVSYGAEKDEKLKHYLKAYILTTQKNHISLSKLRASYRKHKDDSNVKGMRALYNKLSELCKNNHFELMKLKTEVCLFLDEPQKVKLFSNQILDFNSQSKWAAMRLVNHYIKLGDFEKAKQAIINSTDFGECFLDLETSYENADWLTLVQHLDFPNPLIQLLKVVALVAEKNAIYDKALSLRKLIVHGHVHDYHERSIAVYELGLLYKKLNQLSQAKEAFRESAKLGQGRYNRAIKALEQLTHVEMGEGSVPIWKKINLKKYERACPDIFFNVQNKKEVIDYVSESVSNQLDQIVKNSG